MAIKYVDSTATGANNGTSWANAYTALSSVASSAAGDEIRVSHTDTQTLFVGLNLGGSVANPVTMWSINKSDDSYAFGAVIVANGQSFDGSYIAHGFLRKTSTSLDFNRNAAGFATARWEDSEFQKTGTGTSEIINYAGSGPCLLELVNCRFTQSSTGKWTGFRPENGSILRLLNCTFAMDFSQGFANALNGIGQPNIYEAVDCDLSAITNLYYTTHTCTNLVHWRRCKTHASLTVSTPVSQDTSEFLLEDCASGTLNVPPVGLVNYTTFRGAITGSLSEYRTGGADDGANANAHSWKFVTNANCRIFQPIKSPSMAVWVPGGASITVTAYVASGATLYDDEVWLEIDGPDNAGSPSARGYFATSRMAQRGTRAALASDSSTWNGSGVGTVQKLSLTYTPTLAGWVTGRVCCGKASATVYVDPKLAVSGVTSTHQRFFSRSQIMGPNESGGGAPIYPGMLTAGLIQTLM